MRKEGCRSFRFFILWTSVEINSMKEASYMPTAPKTSPAYDRVTRLYQFLQALNRSRIVATYSVSDYVWGLSYREMPQHADIHFATPEDEEEAYVRVKRPELIVCPLLPELLREWVQIGWERIDGKPVFVSSLERGRDEEGNLVQETFESSHARIIAKNMWLAEREKWVSVETPAYETMKVFERLYTLWGTLQRDPDKYELILGDGILGWKRGETHIEHPLLLCRLQLEFDAKLPEFRLTPTDRPVTFANSLFQSMADVESKSVSRLREEAKESEIHPLGGEEVNAFLSSVATTLSSQGRFVEELPKTAESYPQLWRSPVIYLAPRNGGYEKALEDILADLESRNALGLELPDHLARIVGATNSKPASSSLYDGTNAFSGASSDGTTTDILFTKPANREQEQIAERLERHGCVLVQGPPGTGKTHTIGNLIGHLLAQGKTVLVTSHTPKALRVLREQVVPELRSLCVAVLNDGKDSRSQLEASVSAIVEKLQSSSVEDFVKQDQQLTKARESIQTKLLKVESDLLQANANEYRDVVFEGRAFTPTAAAKHITAGKSAHDWIPGDVLEGASIPLSPVELAELYALNVKIDPDEERQLSLTLPDMECLMSPEVFAQTLEVREKANGKKAFLTANLWRHELHSQHIPLLEQVLQSLKKTTETLHSAEKWEAELMERGDDKATRERFNELFALIDETEKEGDQAEAAFLNFAPEFHVDGSAEDHALILEEVIVHLKSGRSLNPLTLLTRRKWKDFQNSTKVKGRKPETLEAFEALQTQVAILQKREQLARRWVLQMQSLGGDALSVEDTRMEKACRRFVPRIGAALDWKKASWLSTQVALAQCGFSQEPFETIFRNETETSAKRYAPRVERLIAEVEARLAQHEVAKAVGAIKTLLQELEPLSREAGEGVTVALHRATIAENSEEYEEAYCALGILLSQQTPLRRRHELLAALESVAPGWAAVIRVRSAPHGASTPPGDPHSAWLHAQLRGELERRDRVSPEELTHQRTELTTQLFRTTAELAQCRAWGYQLARTTDTQRSSLMGWLNTVRRIGKGTGKMVATLRKAAREQMQNSSGAVPVWIMPLAQVAESFSPGETQFDVVIVDEASQADAMGLIPLYLAKSVIVVGDHEQVSPDAVGQRVDEAQRLIAQYLDGIPNAVLYDGLRSVYDIAREQFGGTICLSEHFRCAPAIIEFSNRLSYEGRIKPLREVSNVKTRPYVVAHRVENGIKSNKVNDAEANEIVSLVLACLERPEYEGSTFGVVSLVGVEQAVRIEQGLRERVSPEVYEKRRILCGTPPQFQGDEREIMFLSMVDGSLGKPLTMRDGEGNNGMWKKRYNVAASRARNQMWVIYSLSLNTDLKQGDIRRRLIEHALDPMAFQRNATQEKEKADSDFECRVIERLVNAGYRVTSQYPVGAYRIDLVVDDGTKRLAIECDGERYHGLDKLADDMARQAILERLGWTFSRIRGSAFYRDADKAMIPVFEKLKAIGIRAVGGEPEENASTMEAPLLAEIRRRASAIRAEWGAPKPTGKPDTEEEELSLQF